MDDTILLCKNLLVGHRREALLYGLFLNEYRILDYSHELVISLLGSDMKARGLNSYSYHSDY
jgi:hypothetical protein